MSQYIGTSCRPEIFIPRSIFYDQEHHDEHCDTERMIGIYEIVPMLQALRAFREMGATPGDLEREMLMLLTDDAYWHEWCGRIVSDLSRIVLISFSTTFCAAINIHLLELSMPNCTPWTQWSSRGGLGDTPKRKKGPTDPSQERRVSGPFL